MTTTLTRVSTRISARFAEELLELTNAIEAGENVEHRIKVLREYARTWMVVAERVHNDRQFSW
ncbi:MAG: hypothetical protein ABI120_13320 [Gemmatimonadaceae bacterium]